MKKKLVLLLALLLVAAVGCGKNATPGGNGPQTNTPTTPSGSGGTSGGTTPTTGTNNPSGGGGSTQPAAPPQKVNLGPLQPGTLAKVGDIDVTVNKFVVKTKAPGLPPNSTLVYVLALVNVKNNGTVDYPINVMAHFKFQNAEGKTYGLSAAATNTETQRLNGTLKPGESKEGYIGFMAKLTPGTSKFLYSHPDFGDAYWEHKS